MNLSKSKNDEKKEAKDLVDDPTLVFLANINSYKFNVGDILIKKLLQWDEDGEKRVLSTEVDKIGAPIKYVYAFENKIGVGYIKKLKNDGKGPTKAMPICITKVVQAEQHLMLDPDYAEHLLLSADEKFNYNAKYERLKLFREEALKKNEAISIKVVEDRSENELEHESDGETKQTKEFKEFWRGMQAGDTIYASDIDLEDLGDVQFEVLKKSKNGNVKLKIVKDLNGWRDIGSEFSSTRSEFAEEYYCVSKQRPYPLTEDNI